MEGARQDGFLLWALLRERRVDAAGVLYGMIRLI